MLDSHLAALQLGRSVRPGGRSPVDIISTRQVAELLAVSEATVKRWADAGTLRCFRTPGGHRKFRMEDVADFLRNYQYDTAGPISVGPEGNAGTSATLPDAGDASAAPSIDPETVVQFRNAALSADVDSLVSQIAQNRLRGLTLSAIFDHIATAALADIGERWARGVLTVSQEHIAATAVIEALARTRPLIERSGRERGKVLLACPGEEQHDIAMRMGSLLAYGLGFNPMLIGARAPVADLSLLITGERPRYVVISASSAADPRVVAQDVAAIAEASRAAGSKLLAGGDGVVKLGETLADTRVVHSMSDLLEALQGR